MAVTFADLTVDPQTLVDADPTSPVRIIVRTNTGGAIIDSAANKIFLGTYSVDTETTATISLPVTNGATNPTNFQYAVDLEYVDAATRTRKTWSSGWFSFTAAANLASIAAEQYVPPTWMTTAVATLQAKIDEGQALLDAQKEISGLTGEDAAVGALIEGTAGAGPITRAALSTSIEDALAAAFSLSGDYHSKPAISSDEEEFRVVMGGVVGVNPGRNLRTNAGSIKHTDNTGVSGWRFLDLNGNEKGAFGYGNPGISATSPFGDAVFIETSNFINADGSETAPLTLRPMVPLYFVTTGAMTGTNPAVGSQTTNRDYHLRMSIDPDASVRFYRSGPSFASRDPMLRMEGLSGRVGIGYGAADVDVAGGGGAKSPAGELDVWGKAIFGKSTVAKHTDRQNLLSGNSAAVINDAAGLIAFSRWAVGRFDFAVFNDVDADGQGGPRFGFNDKTGAKDGVLQISLDGKRNVGFNSYNFGGGQGVVAIANAVAAPVSSFPGASGGQLYAQGGALKWRGSSGTVTTLAVA